MVQEVFAPPCGCVWYGARQRRPCAAWQPLVDAAEGLRRDPSVEGADASSIEDQLREHMPPWIFDDA